MKKIALVILGILILTSFASATITSVHIKTLPHHDVQVSAINPDAVGFELYEKSIGRADQYGDYFWNFSSEKPSFKLLVYVKWRGETVVSEKSEDEFTAGKEAYFEVAPDGSELIATPNGTAEEVEETAVVVNSTGNESEENESLMEIKDSEDSSATGNAVFGEGGIISMKVLYYILGGIGVLVIIGVVVFFAIKNRNKKMIPREIKITKLSELKAQQQSDAAKNEELKRAEEELRDAQRKITSLKNKERIDELRKEVEEKQRELADLSGEGEAE